MLVEGVAGLFKSAVSANMNVQAGNVNVVGAPGRRGAAAMRSGCSKGGLA